ncbi:hypothetical protein BaRGS_00022812 [Batillaria attramentaria]|uniref:Cyclic nucleotide-binding domain-containing protein n=1 Tax=Batillaria attramentaria TaxID=370345 RepID=A0ABD0KG61_9CAEN
MALVVQERLLASEPRPRSMSKLAEGPAGPRISGRMMTPTKPMSADVRTTGTSATRLERQRRPSSRPKGEKKKEAFVDPNVTTALAAALKAEIALQEFDASPEIPQEVSAVATPSASAPGLVAPPPPGVTLTVGDIRARAEKAAEFEVEHNWMLKEEAEMKVKKFDQTKRKLAIFLPEDDPLEGISNRLEEIQSMVKPKAELSEFLVDMTPEQRERILKITNMDPDTVKNDRRRDWKALDYVRHTFRVVYIMACNTLPSRRYFNPEDPEAGPAVMRRQRKIYGQGGRDKALIKSSLSMEMQISLTTHPDYRTHYDLKRVLWVLRATKAFKHLFPTEMEREVAKVVGYERYDDNRHIAYQGRTPERFYYVLAGRIQKLKEYRLTTGCVNKSMGFMNKGMTSDPEELEQQWFRECHLVAKGPVEVLILHRDDFIRLQHTVQGPPVDFLWSIDLFKEFPCDQFLHNPDAIEFKYYGQNRIVARDINRTPWLHVVKSGFVKVVRVQYVFDVHNEKKFANQSTEELGCGRSFSHAKAMLGLLAKQRKMKTMTDFSLPDLFQRRSQASIEEGLKGKRRKSRLSFQMQQKAVNGATDLPAITVEEDFDEQKREGSATHSAKSKNHTVLPPITKSNHEPSFSNSTTEAPLLVPHGTFLTRERTEAEPHALPPGIVFGKKPKKDPLVRRAYLQLDLLKPGDVFGLEDIAEKFRYQQTESEEPGLYPKDMGLENLDPPPIPVHEGPAISLVSEGAEVIKISKRFFLQHAQNNTMLRVETMQRSYLSTDECKSILYDKETWSQYKHVLMQRLIDSLPRQ